MPSILFVDDDNYLRTMYSEVLTKSGFTVTEAHDGAEGLELVKQNKPDLVFTGIEMPNLTGFELMRKLSADPETREIPVVIFSHRGRESDRRQAEKLGAKAFLFKDFTPPRQAVDKIREVLDRANPTTAFRIKVAPDELDEKQLAQQSKISGNIVLELTPDSDKPDEFRAKVVPETGEKDDFSQILSDVEKKLK